MFAQIERLAKVSSNTHSPEDMCHAVAAALGGSVGYDDDEGDGDVAGIVYFAPEMKLYYAMDATACLDLVERVHVSSKDAYSLWCSATSPCGEGATAAEAARDAGFRLEGTP